MTREEYVDFANALKNNYTIDFDKLPEFCDMAISLLKKNKGKWIYSERFSHIYPMYECSKCSGLTRSCYDRFCTNCGADMREEEDEQ